MENMIFFSRQNNRSDILRSLTDFIAHNCPRGSIVDLKDLIKITYKEADRFTIIQLFFEKSKIVVRHNLKSSDHMIMSEPNFDIIDAILKEIKKLGYHQCCKENDEIYSTCRMEFTRNN